MEIIDAFTGMWDSKLSVSDKLPILFKKDI